jgi:hypothetical protein
VPDVTPDVRADAQAIERALNPWKDDDFQAGAAALKRLLSRLDTLERERDDARMNAIAQAASASQKMWREQKERADAAEARLRAAEEALHALVDVMPYCHVNPNSPRSREWSEWREAALDKAAAALAGVQAPAQEQVSEGDPVEVPRSTGQVDATKGRVQAGLNGPGGSPTSPSEPVQAPAGEGTRVTTRRTQP